MSLATLAYLLIPVMAGIVALSQIGLISRGDHRFGVYVLAGIGMAFVGLVAGWLWYDEVECGDDNLGDCDLGPLSGMIWAFWTVVVFWVAALVNEARLAHLRR